MLGRPNVLNHLSIPAACFTHPEVSFVGVTQDKAEEMAKEQGFKLGVAKTSFKANSKVISQHQTQGLERVETLLTMQRAVGSVCWTTPGALVQGQAAAVWTETQNNEHCFIQHCQ